MHDELIADAKHENTCTPVFATRGTPVARLKSAGRALVGLVDQDQCLVDDVVFVAKGSGGKFDVS